jgi:amino acid adenylation domain-containing protein
MNTQQFCSGQSNHTASTEEFFVLPTSFSQQRMWFIDQFEPGTSAYHIPLPKRLRGNLNLIAFEQSFNEIVRRHEILRTRFVTRNGLPMQVIAPSLRLTVPLVDLTHLPRDEQEIRVRELTKEESERPFNLSRGPLCRLVLLQVAQAEYVSLFTVHHIAFDAWSARVVVRELTAFYKAFSKGNAPTLPELPIQYADFAQWQRDWLQGEALEIQAAYWKQHLGTPPPVQIFPTDHPRPAVMSYRSRHQFLNLPRPLCNSVRALCSQERVTLFMTLLAAFKVLLCRLTGEPSIMLGSPVATRNRAELEPLIGLFINTLVLSTDLSGDPSFRDVLGRVRKSTLEALAHQDIPFEKLVEELQPERDRTRNPLFEVMFQLDTPLPGWEFSGVQAEPYKFVAGQTRFDMTLWFADGADGQLVALLEYKAELFEDVTRTRLLEQLQRLLEAVIHNPEQRLSTIALLSPAEQQQLLSEWNDTDIQHPNDLPLPHMFEAQVKRSPDAIAVTFEDQQLTYSELDQRANQLAHHLRRIGAGEQSLVGICVERSLEMLVGLFGILKAGAAYLPLDPGFPKERLEFVLADAKVAILLTQKSLVSELSSSVIQLVALDSDWSAIARESREFPANVSIENPCYVIYTSGSTGKPKGVQIGHRALTNLLSSVRSEPGIEPQDVLLSVTTLIFDIAALELYLPLIAGAKLVIASREAAADGRRLNALIDTTCPTMIQATPATWRMVIDAGWSGNRALTSLCGGEALSRELASQLTLRSRTLWNMYGPTETTIWSTTDKVATGKISVGSPIANTQCYLLDSKHAPVPVGANGELYIGGDGLAFGYLHRPELTAEKFIPNPFRNNPGTRLYRTGDLARYLNDGRIEYLSRIDNQIKIRGFRIELGEIEAALATHPAVSHAVVQLRDHAGDQRLIAYVVVQKERPDDLAAQLRSFLKSKLPVYMWPSGFLLLEALPLLPNGKVDQQALRRLEPERQTSTSTIQGARNPTEELLAGIWQRVLGIEQVSIHDDFFDLGGHSLLATQVISQVREVFRRELPLKSLFDFPTVASLAEEIERAASDSPGVSSIEPVTRAQNLPLSFAQQRLWFINQLDPDSTHYQITLALRLTGPLNIVALEQSLNEIIRRHEVLRTTFPIVAGRAVQAVSPVQPVNIPIAILTGQEEVVARRLTTEAAQQRFDLAYGPLVRATLLQLNEQEHVGIVMIDHIVCDGWSQGILVREIAQLYEVFSQGQPSPLVELPIQYADYAVWQQRWLTGERLENQLAYWKQQLNGAPPSVNIRPDRPRPTIRTTGAASETLRLSKDSTESLKNLSNKERVTPFITLVTAFQTLVHWYSGQDDICVGTDIAGRNRSEIEELIGFFANQLVLRTDVSGNPTFRELLRRARQVVLGAYSHQELPFERLVEALNPKRDLSRSPLFQVKFVLQNAPMPSLKLSNLSLSHWDVGESRAKFDWLLTMWETDHALAGALEYSTDLFHPTTIAGVVQQYTTLIDAILTQPGARLNALLEILNQADRERQIGQRKAFIESRVSFKAMRETRAGGVPL